MAFIKYNSVLDINENDENIYNIENQFISF